MLSAKAQGLIPPALSFRKLQQRSSDVILERVLFLEEMVLESIGNQ